MYKKEKLHAKHEVLHMGSESQITFFFSFLLKEDL